MYRGHDKKRRRRSIVENDNVDRWLVSYADFITLLFAFFVVMYAISSVNDGKYRVLSDTLIEAFKAPPKNKDTNSIADTSTTLNNPAIRTPVELQIKQQAELPQVKMLRLADDIKQNLQRLVDKKLIKVNSSKLWVEVEINTSILYSSGSAKLERGAYLPLKRLSGILKRLPNFIDVEGYTDDLPINNSVYPSNWELSAARAASVAQLFIKNGIPPQHLSVIGYGQYRPIADNQTPEGRRQNRRVRVVILADKNAHRIQEIESPSTSKSGQEN